MKSSLLLALFAMLLLGQMSFGQNPDAGILKTILATYYKNEKPVYKGRNQLLFLFCGKANNNEEIFETINQLSLPKDEVSRFKRLVDGDKDVKNWADELTEIYASDKTNLNQKINACLSLDEYHEKQKRFNLNNQRMLIISKPLLWRDGKTALVKIVFYRSIEHNNGSILLMKKNANNNWEIVDSLNSWST